MNILSSKAPIRQLDGFRGIAIIIVVIYHMGLNSSLYAHAIIADGGWMVVQLFFILTGFLLSLDYIYQAKNRADYPSLTAFYQKRIFRIFPLYFFSLAVYLIYGYINKSLPVIPTLLLHFIFMENILSETSAVYGPFWSLAVEVQTYLFFPIIGYIIYKTLLSGKTAYLVAFLLFLILAPLAYRIVITGFYSGFDVNQDYIRLIYMSTFSNLDSFGWGILGGLIYAYEIPQKISIIVGWIGFIVSIVLVGWLFDFSHHHQGWLVSEGIFAPAFFYTLLNVGWLLMMISSLVLRTQWMNSFFSNSGLRFIALISYSIYIWHGLMFDFTRYLVSLITIKDWIFLNSFVFFVSSILILIISSASYYLIELPFLKIKGKRLLFLCTFKN